MPFRFRGRETNRACIQNNKEEKVPVVPTESPFLQVDSISKGRLFPWIQYGIHEKRMSFSKRVDSLWK
jgi:hypothetical protein